MDNFNIDMERRQREKRSYKNGLLTGFLMGMGVFLLLLIGNGIVSNILGDKTDSVSLSEEDLDSVNQKIKRIETYLDKYYMEDIDEEALVDGLYYGMTASLGDPYTGYYNQEEYEKLEQSSNGEYCGIGVVVRQDTETNEIYVDRVYSNSPAMEAGIEEGDVIYSVDGELVEGLTMEELTALVLGEKNTTFEMSVMREDECLDFELTRREITVDTVSYEMKEDKIGYIKIEEFDGVTAEQVEDAINDLNEQGMESIIIDLRDNPGGRLDALKHIAGMFLEEDKLLIYSKTKDGTRTDYYTEKEDIKLDIPMVVLVNEESASAAEAFSGAMQCYERAEIVGTTTFGKGIMQSIFPLEDGSALKITIGKYYLPNDENIHKIGITPDYEVENPEDSDENSEDLQLEKAMDLLSE